jgi:hypothetical protein
VHLFDILTSKSAPRPPVFLNSFDLEICATPQRHVLFAYLNFQKGSEAEAFCTFDIEMCFAPQQRALFQHLNFQKCCGVEVFLAF